MMDSVDLHVRALVLDGARAARTGYDPDATVVCAYCGAVVNPAAGAEAYDGFCCDTCALHPRFDFDDCPDCGAHWSETMQPCPGCHLTIEAVAERFAKR